MNNITENIITRCRRLQYKEQLYTAKYYIGLTKALTLYFIFIVVSSVIFISDLIFGSPDPLIVFLSASMGVSAIFGVISVFLRMSNNIQEINKKITELNKLLEEKE